MNILTRAFNDSKSTLLCLGLTLFSVAAAQAQTVLSWVGGSLVAPNSWNRPENWLPAQVPAAGDFVTINPTTNACILNALGRVRDVTINSGASLTLGASGILNLGGNLLDNTGAQFGGPGVVNITGAFLPQSIGGGGTGVSGSGPINIKDLMVGPSGAAGATLNHSMDISRLLDLSGILNTNLNPSMSTLRLLSDPTQTAFVIDRAVPTIPFPNLSFVNGPITVQRAIDGSANVGLGYRHYSAPVAATTIADLTVPGVGGFTPEVSAGAAYNASTFPRATTPFPTVYDYLESRVANTTISYPGSNIDRGYEVPNPSLGTGALLEVTRGYAVNIASTALVDFVGTLNNGTYTRTLTRTLAAGTDDALMGWQLLGNPYPAPLDFSVIAPPPGTAQPDLVGVDAALYVVQSTSQYGNTYRSYTSSSNSINPVIPVGQGFYVHVTTSNSTGSITFRNSQRLLTDDYTSFQRPTPITHPQVELSLRSNANPIINDVAVVYFDNGSTVGPDARYDAVKLVNSTGLNMSTLTPGGQSMAIDARPVPTSQLTLPLQVFVPTNGTYTLRADQLRNMGSLNTYLHDMQTGAMINLAQVSSYTFSMVATNLSPRFELVFSASVLATAPAALSQQVSLYPSPTKGAAFVELPASLGGRAIQGTLVDALGRTVRTIALPAQGTAAHKVDVSGLTAGVYALRLNTSAGMVVKRLVIE